MRKQQIEILEQIQRIQKDQIYLMQIPKTPQQQFLHLFAHRHLLKEKMIHKNIDRSLNLLNGSFAQSSLQLAYITLCIQNQIEVTQGLNTLLSLIHGWVQFYPTIDRNQKITFTELILQENTSIQDINGYDTYLHYVNLISTDLWKLLKKTKSIDAFFKQRPFKEQYGQWNEADLKHLDALDLLTFVSSCIPKVLLNIILQKASLPAQMREKFKKFECLFSNQNIQYYLRNNEKLALLLKSIFLALFALDLSTSQQKFLMLVAMRYYFVFHFVRKLSAPQIFVFSFNKINEEVRLSLKDEFVLFVKIIKKLGKQKFLSFLQKNSAFLKQLIETVNRKPLVGYSQDTAMPYNTIGVGQTINLERGETTYRYFEVLEENSIFYYRVLVKNMDITIRLYYMGQIASEKQTKILLLTQEKKSGQIKNCVNAIKKGIYMFEFDNTYSWINGKSLKYENVIYSPLEIKSVDCEEWIEDFYDNIYQNCINKEEDIYVVQKRVALKKRQDNNNLSFTLANISKKQSTFTLTISRPTLKYEYQTDNPQRMEVKVAAILKEKEDLSWAIQNKPVSYLTDIQNFIKGTASLKVNQQQQPVSEKIQRYQEEDQSSEQEATEEYQVVQRQLEESQIFNESPQSFSTAKVQEPKKDQKQKKVEVKSKDQIICNSEQADQFYSQSVK